MSTLKQGGSRENVDLKFLETRKIRVSTSVADPVRQGIAVSESFGLLFAITNQTRVDVLSLHHVFDFDWSKSIINQTIDASPVTAFTTHFHACFLSVSGTGRALLASGPTASSCDLTFYDVEQVSKTRTASPFASVSLPNSPKHVTSVDWHPEFADSLLIACFSDGSVTTIAINVSNRTSCKLADYITSPGITAVSWSPKGKQVILGRSNGSITFFKHTSGTGFTEARNIAAHDELKTYSVHSIKWLTSSLIYACFVDPNNDQDPCSRYLMITAPAKAMPDYFDYGRILMDFAEYQNSNKDYTVSLHLVGNMMMTSSSHSSEVAVIGCSNNSDSSNPQSWDQVILDDSARIELPMNGTNDTYTRGVAFTSSCLKTFKLSENDMIGGPGTPCVFILTNAGIICPYLMVSRSNVIQPLAPALPVQQLPFTPGPQASIPAGKAAVPADAGHRFPSPNDFCPPSASTPTAKTPAASSSSVFGGLKAATFGSNKPISQPITQSPISSLTPDAGSSSLLRQSTVSNVFGSNNAPSTPIHGKDTFSFGAAAAGLLASETAAAPAVVSTPTNNRSVGNVAATPAPDDRDIPLEEVESEISSMKSLISDHKARIRKFFASNQLNDDEFMAEFSRRVSAFPADFQDVKDRIEDQRLDVKCIKGEIGQDLESLAVIERKVLRMRDVKMMKLLSNYKLDHLTADKLKRVMTAADQIQKQLQSLSQSLTNDWSNFIDRTNGEGKRSTGRTTEDKVDMIRKAISDLSLSFVALDKSVTDIESRTGIR